MNTDDLIDTVTSLRSLVAKLRRVLHDIQPYLVGSEAHEMVAEVLKVKVTKCEIH